MFITAHFYPESGATEGILLTLARRLQARGHRVLVVSATACVSNARIASHDGVRFVEIKRWEMPAFRKQISRMKSDRNFLGIVKATLTAPYFKLKRHCNSSHSENVLRTARGALAWVKTEKPDVIIAVCDPFSMIEVGCLVARKSRTKWLMYMLDPYFDNNADGDRQERLLRERRAIECADAVVVTHPIHRSYGDVLGLELAKVTPMGIPMIPEQRRSIEVQATVKTAPIDSVTCVYTGWLYPDIRNPQYLLDLFVRMQDERFRLYLVGGVFGQFPTGYFDYYREVLGDSLVITGELTRSEAQEFQAQADVLINLGNTVYNHLPSKIFEYMAIGKPIANFTRIDGCPTLPYLEQYPLALNLKEDDEPTALAVSRFRDFCLKARGKTVTHEFVLREFAEYSEHVVAQEFESALLGVLAKGEHGSDSDSRT